MLSPATSLTKIPGIGPKMAEKLGFAGLFTVQDLAYYLPRLWEDLSKTTPIALLESTGEKHTIRARLGEIKSFRSPRKRMHITQATAEDSSGKAQLVWFNQPYLAKSLKVDTEYFFTGKAERSANGISFVSPTTEEADNTPIHSGRIVPTYPETLGITTKVFRKLFIAIRGRASSAKAESYISYFG